MTKPKKVSAENDAVFEELFKESSQKNAEQQTMEPEIVEPVIKMVEIMPKRDFKACIGGVWYFCRKDVKRMVPTYVRDIFLKDPTKIRY